MQDLFEDELERQLEIRVQKELERIADNPDAVIAAYAKKLQQTQQAMDYMRKEMEPKADFYDTVTQSDDWCEMTEVSKLIICHLIPLQLGDMQSCISITNL